jgi:hypothetical protein
VDAVATQVVATMVVTVPDQAVAEVPEERSMVARAQVVALAVVAKDEVAVVVVVAREVEKVPALAWVASVEMLTTPTLLSTQT